MKAYIAVVRQRYGVMEKYQSFDTLAEADAHVAAYGGFSCTNPGGHTRYWTLDPTAKTATHDAPGQQLAEDTRTWENDMTTSDNGMNRSTEDVIDSMDAAQLSKLPQATVDRHAAKKTLRGQRP